MQGVLNAPHAWRHTHEEQRKLLSTPLNNFFFPFLLAMSMLFTELHTYTQRE